MCFNLPIDFGISVKLLSQRYSNFKSVNLPIDFGIYFIENALKKIEILTF